MMYRFHDDALYKSTFTYLLSLVVTEMTYLIQTMLTVYPRCSNCSGSSRLTN